MTARPILLAILVAGGVLALPSRAHAQFTKSSPGELAKSHAAIDSADQCSSCHDDDANGALSAAKCLGCHDHQDLKKEIDANHGFHASPKAKGRECKLCHQEHKGRNFDLMGWRSLPGGQPKFDHAQTGWQLQGKHAVTPCTKCHKDSDKQGLRTFLGADKTCGGCHKDQPHGDVRKSMLACDRCHLETVWKPNKTTLDFNHNSKSDAAMPLEGTHADVACTKCHAKAAFILPKYDGGCELCHKSPHDGQIFGTKKCQLCHSPALGSMDSIRFNHKKETGYPILGKHAEIACERCHTKSLGKRKPVASCEGCHANDNKHEQRFKQFGDPPVCSTCHSQRGWKKDFDFNHATNTNFPLTAKHAKTACRSCHRGKTPSAFERFDIKNGCMSCHRHQKAHGGQYQKNECLTCHEEGGSKVMKEKAYETYHGEKSKFPLRNAHAGIQCKMCHVNDVYKETPRECGVSCHEDSLHKGSLGQECSRCHEPGQWPAVRFDHTADTKWPLAGKHAGVKACDGCHPTREYHGTPTTCGASSCHKSDDVHAGKLGTKCETCHREDAAIVFRHNRDSKFQIDGAHTTLLCASCHPSIEFKPVRNDCVGCHPEPAVHKGRYGLACERCHSTSSFKDIAALHDVGDFSLEGAHDQLECRRCHERGENRRGSGNLCVTCHKNDDIHQNSLSPRCGECHTQFSFAPARFDHLQVGCNLIGLHQTLPCADCHTNGNFGAVSPLCLSCHRDDAKAVRLPDHSSLFECGRCHNPSSWVPATELGSQSICK